MEEIQKMFDNKNKEFNDLNDYIDNLWKENQKLYKKYKKTEKQEDWNIYLQDVDNYKRIRDEMSSKIIFLAAELSGISKSLELIQKT